MGPQMGDLLVLVPALGDLERRGEVEDRAAVLDRRDLPRGEARSIPEAVDEVDDRRGEIAGEDEVTVKRVGLTRPVDGPARGHERLREHLPAEHSTGSDVPVAAAIDVDLERFEIEEVEEIGERYGHFLGVAVRATAMADWLTTID